jgi:hypothetical protein
MIEIKTFEFDIDISATSIADGCFYLQFSALHLQVGRDECNVMACR